MICAVVLPKMPPRTPVPCAVRVVGLARARRAAKLVGNILPMPSNLCSAVDKAVRSQFWADFAQTEICHGARTRRWHRHIAGSSRARRSMPANLGPRDRWLFSTIGNILPLPPLWRHPAQTAMQPNSELAHTKGTAAKHGAAGHGMGNRGSTRSSKRSTSW